MSRITVNTTTGTFVNGRRSQRLAAKRGEVLVELRPRVQQFPETVTASTSSESQRRTSPRLAASPAVRPPAVPAEGWRAWSRLVEYNVKRKAARKAAREAAQEVKERRTSPRLTDYYAKRQAAAKQKEVTFRLIKEVLAFANRPKVVTPPATETETKTKAKDIRAWADIILPLISRRGGKVTVSEVVELLTVIYDHPTTGIAFLARPEFGVILRRKLSEFRAHPTATPSLRLLCDAVEGILPAS
jgi:hypothetical protein